MNYHMNNLYAQVRISIHSANGILDKGL